MHLHLIVWFSYYTHLHLHLLRSVLTWCGACGFLGCVGITYKLHPYQLPTEVIIKKNWKYNLTAKPKIVHIELIFIMRKFHQNQFLSFDQSFLPQDEPCTSQATYHFFFFSFFSQFEHPFVLQCLITFQKFNQLISFILLQRTHLFIHCLQVLDLFLYEFVLHESSWAPHCIAFIHSISCQSKGLELPSISVVFLEKESITVLTPHKTVTNVEASGFDYHVMVSPFNGAFVGIRAGPRVSLANPWARANPPPPHPPGATKRKKK